MINLISDTVTKPTNAMREYMLSAPVGDDVFGEDPTINQLQNKLAKLFNMEAGLYCPSGVMANQIAIRLHTKPMDEMICDKFSHVYTSENGGYGYNAGIGINLIDGDFGKITPDQIKAAVKPTFDWLPHSKLVVIENSCNIAGGAFYTLDEIKAISKTCHDLNLILHVDGARIFNALAESKDRPQDYGEHIDSISICLSKGLGAPVGTVLLSSNENITQAKRIRKAMGGGMRQAGIIAAAGIYALDHHIPLLANDNQNAKKLGNCLAELSYIKSVRPVKTNIVIFDLDENISSSKFLDYLSQANIKAAAFGPHTVRFVTHFEISNEQIEEVIRVIKEFQK